MHKFLFLFAFLFLVVVACSSDSGDEAPAPDTIAPVVDFQIAGITDISTTPVVSNQIVVTANAQDAGGIQKVEAFINDVKKREDTTAPYSIVIDVSTFTSKTASSAKYTDYYLKVIATDMAGNIDEKEILIYIDNELPSISEVSLAQESVINGDTNEVLFSVSDNESLIQVNTYINDQLLSEDLQEPYSENLNTLNLSDGPNVLKIEAIDEAGNIGFYNLNFVADNTGPDINLDAVTQGVVIDSLLQLNPVVTDPYSAVTNFTLSINGTPVIESSSGDFDPVELDPEGFPTGAITFELTASDELGNTSNLDISTEIKRRLFVARFNEGFFETDWIGFWILISQPDGSYITNVAANFNSSSLKVHAPGEFDLNKEYMVTFITEEDHGSWRQPHMTNIQDLTRQNFKEITFSPGFGEQIIPNPIPLNGFYGVEAVVARGHGYQSVHGPEVSQLDLEFYGGNGYGNYSAVYLIGYYMGDYPDDYGYYRLADPMTTGQTVNRSDFILDNTTRGNLDYSQNSYTNEDTSLYIYGFESASDLSDNNSNLLFDRNYAFGFSGSIDYAFPDVFEYYQHHFRLNNYNTYRDGLPTATYTVPDWTLDLIQNGNEILVNQSGSGFITGRVILEIGNENTGSIQMPLIYNPAGTTSVYIPELPEDLNNLAIYNVFQSNSYSITNGDITSFNTITSYNQYLDEVISMYKEHQEVAPVMETILFRNGFIFPHWPMKYW